jgi:hypothetical protein
VPGPPLELGPALDLLDDGGVEAEPDVEQEEAAVHAAEPDVLDVPGGQPVEQRAGRLDGVVGQADRAGEHVRRAPGQGRQGRARAGQAVGGLVQRAVPAEHDDDLDALVGGPPGEAGGVVAAVRRGDRDVVIGRERLLDHDLAARRDRRRGRVDQQEDAQGAERYAVLSRRKLPWQDRRP